MILIAAGDSFVWGSELKDSPHGGPDGYSRNTFTSLIAKDFGYDYVCAAYPGSANNAISRMALVACEKSTVEKILIVNWTYPQRIEFRIKDKWVSLNSWHTEEKEFSQQYFKHIGNSEYVEIFSILKEILFLQQYCEINRIPYLFMASDNHFYQTDNYMRSKDIYIESLYNKINWNNWFWFDPGTKTSETLVPRGFYQWAVENKYSIGTDGHPLEQAHRDAAELIKEKFNELVKKSI